MMDSSTLSLILRELNLTEDCVANIYHHGSWVHGTNKPTSDRDLFIVTRRPQQPPLQFHDDFDYFHEFELHKLWNQFDVCVHTVENFEVLLEKNYLLAVECVFLPKEYILKQEIDFRSIYLDKYYDVARLKKAAFYEHDCSMRMYDENDDSMYPVRSSTSGETSQASRDYLFKNLFHGLRFLDLAQQLISSRAILDFKRMTPVLEEMKAIRGDPTVDSNTEAVLEYVRAYGADFKAKLDELVPKNVIKGTFEAHITIDCSHNTPQVIERLQKICDKTNYKLMFIHLNTGNPKHELKQLMTSSYHCGEYPSIVSQIEREANEHFAEFNIVRMKIESLASNEGVPETDIDKRLFWDVKSNYFEFHYKVVVKKTSDERNYHNLKGLCSRWHRAILHLSHNTFKQFNDGTQHYFVTMRLFDVGRQRAMELNDETTDHLTRNKFKPLKVEQKYVVYDSYIELDNDWQ